MVEENDGGVDLDGRERGRARVGRRHEGGGEVGRGGLGRLEGGGGGRPLRSVPVGNQALQAEGFLLKKKVAMEGRARD